MNVLNNIMSYPPYTNQVGPTIVPQGTTNSNSNSNTNANTNANSNLYSISSNTYDYINNLLANPTIIIIVVGVFIAYLVVFMTLGSSNKPTQEANASSISSILGLDKGTSQNNFNIFKGITNSSESTSTNNTSFIYIIVLAIIFLILIIAGGFQYFFGMNITAAIKNIFSPVPEIDIGLNKPNTNNPIPVPISTTSLLPQVFNIPDNKYVYEDAKALCSAYGARLATYKEIEKSYNEGGEWCNYGWSEDQMALFPTQQKTWFNLQKIPGHENDCGRPGINGGYMANPQIRFGVNCYGHKPNINQEEELLMANQSIYPKTEKDILMERRVNYWKNKISQILVSPFNYNNWSRI
jgi:flagellar basal body-associated protein FliL